jgi:gliding motility-associated-like protein
VPVPAFLPDSIKGCLPVIANFNSTSLTTNVSTYQWSFGDNTTGSCKTVSHTYVDPGYYTVALTVTNSYGCSASIAKTDVVAVEAKPVADFATDPTTTSLLMPTINFSNHSTGANAYNWHFGDGSAMNVEWNPSHTYSDTGHYTIQLIATSEFGCKDTALREIIVTPDMSIFIPNAFTPDQDRLNEGFTGYGVGIAAANFTIYDRWGKLIYTGSSLQEPWNGTFQNNGNPCPQGVYVYLFDVTAADGNEYSYKGRVTLIR